jgi:hypothetical protein
MILSSSSHTAPAARQKCLPLAVFWFIDRRLLQRFPLHCGSVKSHRRFVVPAFPRFDLKHAIRFIPHLLILAGGLFTLADLRAAVPESSYADLHWRLVGPFRGGWVTAVAGHPDEAMTFYFGSADGGVWRTGNAGVTWEPLFEDGGSASIGALTLAPGNPDVIWIGTGQIQQRWDIADGDGVYRSLDGGQSWQHAGLADSRHIGALWVDPRDADTAVVAALGHVFGRALEQSAVPG